MQTLGSFKPEALEKEKAANFKMITSPRWLLCIHVPEADIWSGYIGYTQHVLYHCVYLGICV